MIAAVSVVRDEADIIGLTVGNMVEQVDHVIVADNGSTDGTGDILRELGVEVVEDTDPAHYQSRKMSALARRAESRGATWVVPFDADEVWRPTVARTVGAALGELPLEARIADAVVYDHVAADVFPSPWRRAEMLPLRKVACRPQWVTIHDGNHGASYEDQSHPLTVTGLLEIHHFPYRSASQMIRKARNGSAALAATDLPEDVGKHWRDYGRLSDEQLTEVFFEHFHSVDPAADGLVYDPCVLSA